MSIGAKCRPHEPEWRPEAGCEQLGAMFPLAFKRFAGWTCAKCGAELRATWMRKDEKRKRGRA